MWNYASKYLNHNALRNWTFMIIYSLSETHHFRLSFKTPWRSALTPGCIRKSLLWKYKSGPSGCLQIMLSKLTGEFISTHLLNFAYVKLLLTILRYRVPVPRFLGLVRLPLSHVFRRNLSSDPEEVFYWSCAPWGSAFILNSIAVYPLFQPSVSSMDDCWVAFMIVSGKVCIIVI